MGETVKVAETDEVPPGEAKAVDVQGKTVALFNVDGTFYAIGDTCTHRGGPLSEGVVDGNTVTCPWHGAEFDLTNGTVLGPPAGDDVGCYRVIVDGADIKIELP